MQAQVEPGTPIQAPISKAPINLKRLSVFAGIIVVLGALIILFAQQQGNPIGYATLTETPDNEPAASDTQDGTASLGSPLRKTYFKEAFQPKRDQYNLLETAAKNKGVAVADIERVLELKNEEDIYSDLPSLPGDFGEVAYGIFNGQYLSIGLLGAEYYKQPEFYPGFKDNGFKAWTDFDPQYWTPQGYGSYPALQEDVLVLGKRETATGIVFVHTDWGVQAWQGARITSTAKTRECFDVTITPDAFLLDPSWPRFGSNWGQRIEVIAQLKPACRKQGTYQVELEMVHPPKDLAAQWALEHKNLYFSAAGMFSAGSLLEVNVKVEEPN
ncbi:MAG: hypothetical protein HY393_04295 [Candidatus Diapherotrites archaeon]|nr:hypothetical protein [Candidatus Diapherotrites archaeon]